MIFVFLFAYSALCLWNPSLPFASGGLAEIGYGANRLRINLQSKPSVDFFSFDITISPERSSIDLFSLAEGGVPVLALDFSFQSFDDTGGIGTIGCYQGLRMPVALLSNGTFRSRTGKGVDKNPAYNRARVQILGQLNSSTSTFEISTRQDDRDAWQPFCLVQRAPILVQPVSISAVFESVQTNRTAVIWDSILSRFALTRAEQQQMEIPSNCISPGPYMFESFVSYVPVLNVQRYIWRFDTLAFTSPMTTAGTLIIGGQFAYRYEDAGLKFQWHQGQFQPCCPIGTNTSAYIEQKQPNSVTIRSQLANQSNVTVRIEIDTTTHLHTTYVNDAFIAGANYAMSNQNYTAYTHLTFAQATYPFAYGDGPPLMVCNPRLSVVSIGGGATILLQPEKTSFYSTTTMNAGQTNPPASTKSTTIGSSTTMTISSQPATPSTIMTRSRVTSTSTTSTTTSTTTTTTSSSILGDTQTTTTNVTLLEKSTMTPLMITSTRSTVGTPEQLGIVFAVFGLALIFIVVFLLCLRHRRRLRQTNSSNDIVVNRVSPGGAVDNNNSSNGSIPEIASSSQRTYTSVNSNYSKIDLPGANGVRNEYVVGQFEAPQKPYTTTSQYASSSPPSTSSHYTALTANSNR